MAADKPAKPREPLTPRQEDVLCLIGEGLTAQEMGDLLGIRTETVIAHVQTLKRKFAVARKRHLVPASRRYFSHGPLVPQDRMGARDV